MVCRYLAPAMWVVFGTRPKCYKAHPAKTDNGVVTFSSPACRAARSGRTNRWSVRSRNVH